MRRVISLSLLLASACIFGFAALPRQDPGPQFGKVYSALFDDMTLVNRKQFGLSRIPTTHHNVLDPTMSVDAGKARMDYDDNQKALLALRKEVEGQGWKIVEGVAEPSTATPKSTAGPKPAPYMRWVAYPRAEIREFSSVMSDRNLAARIQTQLLQSSDSSYREIVDGVTVYAEKIPFRHTECLSCHAGAKLGDAATFAVFAYKKQAPQG